MALTATAGFGTNGTGAVVLEGRYAHPYGPSRIVFRLIKTESTLI